MVDVNKIIEFWFGSKLEPKSQSFWFNGGESFDVLVTKTFKSTYDQALGSDLKPLQNDPYGSLALILLFDQFPRHFFRGTSRMFSTDALALDIARMCVIKGQDQILPTAMRAFLYLPFEHSEDLDDQKKSLELFNSLEDAVLIAYARSHYKTVEKFGRFPHRNAILGREMTLEEEAFLKNPPAGFFAG